MVNFLEIFYYILTSTVIIQAGISVYYSYNLLKNFKKNLNFALLMMFTNPKTPKAFEILFKSLLIFILGLLIQLIFFFEYWIAWLVTIIYFLGFIYFLKILIKITKES
jgi:hypothetical protein